MISDKNKELLRFFSRMSEIHTNKKNENNLKIPSRDDLRDEPDDNDEKNSCFAHIHEDRRQGFFKDCLYRIAECIQIHVEVIF